MRILLTLLFIACVTVTQAQDFVIRREVRGVLKKQNGRRYKHHKPFQVMDGKGNAINNEINNSGEYYFVATIGDTLEFTITYECRARIKLPPVGDINVICPGRSNRTMALEHVTARPSDPDDTPVVFSMNDRTPAHYFRKQYSYDTRELEGQLAWNIQKIEPGNVVPLSYPYGTDRGFLEITADEYKGTDRRPVGFEVRFNSRIGMEQHTVIPASQGSFAQGATDGTQSVWKGPELFRQDASNLFAWGPAVANLEYDGGDYPFDANGRLVPKGTGNGRPANVYGNPSFFRTGLVARNDLQVLTTGLFKGYTQIGVGQKLRQSPLRGSSAETYSAGLALKKMRWNQHLSGELNTTYDYTTGRLVNHGANLSTIMKALMLTPPTFDNANGLSASSASSDQSAWLIPPGSIRSYAPAFADNPYYLLSQLPDRDYDHQLLSTAKLNYQLDNLYVDMTGSYQWLRNEQNIGVPFRGSVYYLDGRLTQQTTDRAVASFSLSPRYSWNKFDFSANYQYTWMQSGIDLYSQGETEYSDNHTGFRRMNEVSWKAEYRDRYPVDFTASIANKHYFSNTSSGFTNWFPSAAFSINMSHWFNNWVYTDIFQQLTIGATASRGIYEAPLLYGSLAALSTPAPASLSDRFYEYTYIAFAEGAKPEISSNIEIGFLTRFLNNFGLDLNYTGTTTRDFIAPLYDGARWVPFNAAKVGNRSFTATATYRNNRNYSSYPYWSVKLMWAKTKAIVRELYGTDDHIALAGFSDVRTVLAEDRPVGAIYGSGWLCDDQGRRIVGNDGFPLKDASLRMIGDPTPDWTASIWPNVSWRGINVDFTLEFRKGGDVWNGTRAAMDYYGMSKGTAADRGVTGYVFDGVTVSGQTNTQAVDFYNPAQPLGDNRWVRYDVEGVGEDYIEDASWVRLSEVAVSYTLPRKLTGWKLQEMKVSLSGHNLLMWTPYTGVDPSSSLYNYTSGAGLDLFNLPGVRSYMFSIEMKFW